MKTEVDVKHITLLAEDLSGLVAAVPAGSRYPALERILSRGHANCLDVPDANHLRFALYGIEPDGDVPVAALTHVNDSRKRKKNNYYWLRTDPVTMWADMARVFMTSYGFADLNPFERNELENCIRTVLEEEGIDLHADHPERWCIALNEPLEFQFTPLERALGMDVAEALPDHPEARYWRRVLNEIQVALHNCPVNVRRRQNGQQEVNSVWFWGGGFIPESAPHDLFDTVYSDHPVSRGLAIINDCKLKPQGEALRPDFGGDGRTVLVDWCVATRDAVAELNRLENLASALLEQVASGEAILSLFDGSGAGREFNRRSGRRFWRPIRPLARSLTLPSAA